MKALRDRGLASSSMIMGVFDLIIKSSIIHAEFEYLFLSSM